MTNLRNGLRSEKAQVAKLFNPNKPGVGYFLTLSEPGLLSAQDYVAYRIREIPLITSATSILVLKEWNNWMRSLSGCDCGSWSFAASRAPALTKKIVSEWISEGTQEPNSSLPQSSNSQPLPQSPQVAQFTQPIQFASSQPAQSDLLSSSMAESSELSINESSSSSITMTPAVLDEMRKQFSKNYNDYSGLPWLLSSGTNVDNILFQHAMTLTFESPLHSFVLDRAESLINLFEERDQELFKVALDRSDSIEELPLLPEWKGREIMRYSKDLDGVAEVTWYPEQNTISNGLDQAELRGFNKRLYSTMLRLSILYEDCNNALSESQSESWYIKKVWFTLFDSIVSGNTWLDFQPGEVNSSASSSRRNSDRDLGTRFACGGKIDGLFTCKKKKFEMGAVEIGPKDQGATGTKVLKDSRKLAKLLKDMFDHICSICLNPGNIRTQLRVYGFLISGLRVEFVSLKYVDGRFYCLTRERTHSIPTTWDNLSVMSILVLVKEFLVFRERMESMAKIVYSHIHLDADGCLRELLGMSRSVAPPINHARTLSTPTSSSKRRRPVTE
ncbi:hypothetical protein BGZ46_003760 [Entomortierella lignicola]|nr:hypothetical protein BGZ46_003760 [Entomortierella lignicola]